LEKTNADRTEAVFKELKKLVTALKKEANAQKSELKPFKKDSEKTSPGNQGKA
jgi:hypothetical protein